MDDAESSNAKLRVLHEVTTCIIANLNIVHYYFYELNMSREPMSGCISILANREIRVCVVLQV